MSVEQSQSELIVEQQKTIAVLSNTVAQMWNEVNDLRGQLNRKETDVSGAPSTSIASTSEVSSACGAEESLEDHVEAISKVNTFHKEVVTLEEAIGVLQISNAQLLKKMMLMQKMVFDLSVSNAGLKVSNNKLTASNAELSASNIKQEASHTELARRISNMEMSDRNQRASIDELRGSNAELGATYRELASRISSLETAPTISRERREALSRELWEAALKGNSEIIPLLVAEGANFEYRGHLATRALHVAAGNGHINAVNALINLGAPVEARDIDGTTALFHAVHSKCEECVKVLLLAGASVHAKDKKGQSPLHHAASSGSLPIAKMLIDVGADREVRDEYGKIPKDLTGDIFLRALL